MSEAERRFLDDVLEHAGETKAGVQWKKGVVSATRTDLDMLLDGERLTFCTGATWSDQGSLISQMGRDRGRFTFVRQKAARAHLC
ncbi:hypothetical protein [Streptomyces sp. NPDC006879]|uniref:hypothetical protein n=1 Tax=Streptomyces sp. NPDC006879 TaxID=3364767 RepID=UPI003685ED82